MQPEHEGETGTAPVSITFQVRFHKSTLDNATLVSAVAELTENDLFGKMTRGEKAKAFRYLAEVYSEN